MNGILILSHLMRTIKKTGKEVTVKTDIELYYEDRLTEADERDHISMVLRVVSPEEFVFDECGIEIEILDVGDF